MKFNRRCSKVMAVGCTLILVFGFSANTFAYTRLYETRESQTVVKGVTYDKSQIYTTEGNVDVHILKIDLTNPNLEVKPVESSVEIGLKETVQSLIKNSGAVAGVNSAYFGLQGNYSASFGPVVADGELISVGTDKNINKKEFATYFIDEYGNSFMDYASVELEFLNDGVSNLNFASINKITEMKYPIYFDRNGGNDTRALDGRFSGLVKIVVEDDEITYISQKGETVTVPENGYLIIINSDTADAVISKFAVGQSAEFNIHSNINFDSIESAISGGGVILQNGVKPADLGENVSGRNPRTILGTDRDGKTLILMCIDGKRGASSTSIGATLDEAIELLKEEGVYNAMSLDGGGSTTMAADFGATGNVEVVNTPAEGSQRKVTTAAGVFDTAQTGSIKQLVIEPSSERGFIGSAVTLNVYGLDENLHRVSVPVSEVSFECIGGMVSGNVLTVNSAGMIPISASYNGCTGVASVQGLQAAYITPSSRSLTLNNGQSVSLTFTATSTDGYSAPITGVEITSDFLNVNGNTVTAVKEGSGYAKCTYNGLTAYVKAGVGTVEKTVTSFEGYSNLGFSAYPASITGISGPSTAVVQDGGNSVAISYNFAESSSTQAAYLTFNEPIAISGEPVSLKLAVYGDGSHNWIRGKIKDSNGAEQVIDFTRDMNWTGWQDTEAALPGGLSYPISLTEVYVAALTNTNTEKQVVYFDNLRGSFGSAGEVTTPEEVKLSDSMYKKIDSRASGAYYITIGGDVVSKKAMEKDADTYTDARIAAFNSLNTLTDMLYYGGGTDISRKSDKETVVYDSLYKTYDRPGVTIVQMTAAKGGIKATAASQWTRFKSDIINLNNNNVIFVMDKTPSYFSDTVDRDMFRKALDDIRQTGKNIIVVSADGYGYWSSAKDGIIYINLPDLWYETGSLNRNYKILRIEVTENGMSYDVSSVF